MGMGQGRGTQKLIILFKYLFYNSALNFVKTSGFIALSTSAQTALKSLEIDTTAPNSMHAIGQD